MNAKPTYRQHDESRPGAYREWTNHEVEAIRTKYRRIGTRCCPGRTPLAVRKKAQLLGEAVPVSRWTAGEDALLLSGKSVPGRSPDAMRHRRKRLGANAGAAS